MVHNINLRLMSTKKAFIAIIITKSLNFSTACIRGNTIDKVAYATVALCAITQSLNVTTRVIVINVYKVVRYGYHNAI